MTALWASNRGEIACERHMGGYATVELQRRPKARRITTPLDVWERWTEEDDAAWLAEIGTPASCETCARAT